MSARALTTEARSVLEHSLTANNVVRGILLRRAERLLAQAEVLVNARMESMPKVFIDAILDQKPGDAPRVVAVFPEMTREEFIAWSEKQKLRSKKENQ